MSISDAERIKALEDELAGARFAAESHLNTVKLQKTIIARFTEQAPIQSAGAAEFAELRKLAEAATPGPWHVVYGDDRSAMCMTAVTAEPKRARNVGEFKDHEPLVAITYHQTYPAVDADSDDCGNANSAYIAAANPAAVLRLLERVAVLEGRQERDRAQLVLAAEICDAALAVPATAPTVHCRDPLNLPALLREFAADNGYSHNDYADVMRQAADELERTPTTAPTVQAAPSLTVEGIAQSVRVWFPDRANQADYFAEALVTGQPHWTERALSGEPAAKEG